MSLTVMGERAQVAGGNERHVCVELKVDVLETHESAERPLLIKTRRHVGQKNKPVFLCREFINGVLCHNLFELKSQPDTNAVLNKA